MAKMTCSDVTLCSWNSPDRTLSFQICSRQATRTTEFGNWCRNVCTRHPSATPATWSSASL